LKRIALCLLNVLVLVVPLTAAPQSVVDDQGNEVLLATEPMRIVSLAPSNTELLFALGLGGRVVGVTRFCNYPPEAEDIEEVAGFSDLSVEMIASVRPDLVLASRGNDAESIETVRQMGVPIFALANNSVAQVIESVRRLGRLTGQQQAAAALSQSLQARLDTVATLVAADSSVAMPRVLWGFVGDPIYTAGKGSIIDDVIRTAGGVNLGREAGDGWPQVSLETVVDWRVDVLLTSLHIDAGSVEDAVDAELRRMRDLDGWRHLPAVTSGRLVHIDGDMLTRPGPRIIDAVEHLAAKLHPIEGGPRGE
jgi:iron complex transport system substrate-binding protein